MTRRTIYVLLMEINKGSRKDEHQKQSSQERINES